MAARVIFFCLLALGLSLALPEVRATADVIPDEAWGYVTVRPAAHMFWWLYGCSDASVVRDKQPLVMWLQGGPGGSSTGFGNFMELGPLDVNLQPRNTTWVSAANVLFVDNPVGTGYSYVTENSAYTTNVSGIATDLVTFFSAFLDKMPVFKDLPFFIFSESYGGKMSAAFALALRKAIDASQIDCNFKGVALGDSWISAIDYVNTWGPYLYATSLLNSAGLAEVNSYAKQTADALAKGKFAEATDLWSETENVVEQLTDNVDFYNILLHNAPDDMAKELTFDPSAPGYRHLSRLHQASLSALMNGPIRKKLGDIPDNVTWGGQSGQVFSYQTVDFMKDVISTVDDLLNMGVDVIIYNGQLDLICDTEGTLDWIDKLTWSGLNNFKAAEHKPLYPPSGAATGNTGAFYQTYQNLSFYWILKAGHMVPADAGEMALTMLKLVIGT